MKKRFLYHVGIKVLIASILVLFGIGISSYFETVDASTIMHTLIYCPPRIKCVIGEYGCTGFSSHWKLKTRPRIYQPPYDYYSLSRIMTQNQNEGNMQAVCMYGTGTTKPVKTGGYFVLESINVGYDLMPDRSFPGWKASPNCVGGELACPFFVRKKV